MRNRKQIEKSILAVVRQDGTLRQKLHTLSVEILGHIVEHGDTSLFAMLYNQLGSHSSYRRPLSGWFRHFTGTKIALMEDGETVSYSFKKGASPKDIDVQAADAKPFWEMSEGSNHDQSLLDVWKILGKTLEKYEEAEQAGKIAEGATMTADQVKIIKTMVSVATEKGNVE